MRVCTDRFFFKAITLVIFMVFAGCAEMKGTTTGSTMMVPGEPGVIQSLNVSDDASRIEIKANKPLTYTFYMSPDPAKAVIDLADIDPGNLAKQIDVNAGNIKSIAVTRQSLGAGILCRFEIYLVKDADLNVTTDSADSSLLRVTLGKVRTPEPPPVAKERDGSSLAVVADDKSGSSDRNTEVPSSGETKVAESSIVEKTIPPRDIEPQQAALEPVTPNSAPVTPKEPEVAVSAPEKTNGTTQSMEARGETKAGNQLSSIVVGAEGIDLEISGILGKVDVFKMSHPSRLVVDLVGLKNGTATKNVPINSFGIARARIGASPDKVRVVFDGLKEKIPDYQITQTSSRVKLVFDPAAFKTELGTSPARNDVKPVHKEMVPVASPVEPAVSPPAAKSSKPVVSGSGKFESLDFKVADGYSRITVKTSGPCVVGKPVTAVGGVSITIRNCQIPRHLQRTLDTRAFPAVVKGVTPYQVKMKKSFDAKLMVQLKSVTPATVTQEGDTIEIAFKNPEVRETPAETAENQGKYAPTPAAPRRQAELSPPSVVAPRNEAPKSHFVPSEKRETGAASGKKEYTGRKVSLEFSDADVRKIFQLIAEVSNLNFLISDDVSGTISLKLVNVPWDQALDVIMESKSLEKRQEGNILYIKPKGRFKTQEQEDAEYQRARERAMELKTTIFGINFATLSDVAGQFQSMVSDRGKIMQDTRTNKIIATDTEPRLQKMADLLKILDVPEQQVMIEARIVEATSTFTREMGVQWGIHYRDASASILGINQLDTGFGGVATAPPESGFLSTAGGAMGISFGTLTSNIQVDLRLSAAATAGMIKIVSTPRVVTLNNKQARITQGTSIPCQTTSSEGTKTEWIAAPLELAVTPHVSPDGSILMKISAKNNSVGTQIPNSTCPTVNTKEAMTELVVKNGETTVIGGIYQDTDSDGDSGVPFLKDIPLMGWLFKSNSKNKTKSELLIFITPKIVS